MEGCNYKTMKVTLKRKDVCDLLLACLCADSLSSRNGGAEKWMKLHDELKRQLEEFDSGEKKYTYRVQKWKDKWGWITVGEVPDEEQAEQAVEIGRKNGRRMRYLTVEV